METPIQFYFPKIVKHLLHIHCFVLNVFFFLTIGNQGNVHTYVVIAVDHHSRRFQLNFIELSF